jgi:hypothetical protein
VVILFSLATGASKSTHFVGQLRSVVLDDASGVTFFTGEHRMFRTQLTLTAVAFVAVVVAGLDAMKAGCCTSAQAQTQIASAEPKLWDHNGSVMHLVANGPSREFYYQKPRTGMLEVGVRPGSLLFRGEIENGEYSGTAFIFNMHCGQIPFQVKGQILENDERIVLTGQAPRVGRNCRAYEFSTSSLEFKQVKPNEGAQSQEQFTATAPRVDGPKPDGTSTTSGERPTAPTARAPGRASNTSQSTSVNVAGRGKYCKETGVSGDLDCFYASSDACQKHNNSANARCVPNPVPDL